eukprot:TRINITY_DN27015_c0_g1_i1.p1 TRINITY_DN27015_c0_g1~~TRINITY_DN27015_c0_g1_i1.p1  ORF type:complete len:447 (+),score=91.55 TRINITY_DN27015_c0_g1_i1:47-1387(+)
MRRAFSQVQLRPSGGDDGITVRDGGARPSLGSFMDRLKDGYQRVQDGYQRVQVKARQRSDSCKGRTSETPKSAPRSARRRFRASTGLKVPDAGADDVGLKADAESPQGGRQQSAAFLEDEDMHERWSSVLRGRAASELSVHELRALVADGGMPLKHRLKLWPRWFVPEQEVTGLFEASLDATSAAEIDNDVPRTRPGWLDCAGQKTLRRVLRAFVAQNRGNGYCQGLNDIALVFVVLGFDEGAALRGLCTMSQRLCPGYHDPGLRGYLRDVQVLGVLARRVLPPSVKSRLDNLGVPLDVLASDHLLSLAAWSWPLTATVQLWDLLLLEGQPAVFASYLALLQLYLPRVDEAVAAADGLPGVPGSVDEEPAAVFRRAIRNGAAEEPSRVLQEVRSLVPLILQADIDHLRWVFGREGAEAGCEYAAAGKAPACSSSKKLGPRCVDVCA